MVVTQIRDDAAQRPRQGQALLLFSRITEERKEPVSVLKASIPNCKDVSQEGGKQPGRGLCGAEVMGREAASFWRCHLDTGQPGLPPDFPDAAGESRG